MTPTNQTSINDVMTFIGPRFYTSLDNAYTRGDIIENDLAKEIENGRLFRLIAKMNIVLERQEYEYNQSINLNLISL
jgi:PAB-dependent poly(A)-specific ribonuclease subunit 3